MFQPRVKEFPTSVRSHWSIENMHWVSDVVFGEDASRFRNGAAAENYSFLRKFVISLLKQDTSPGSLKGERKRAASALDHDKPPVAKELAEIDTLQADAMPGSDTV